MTSHMPRTNMLGQLPPRDWLDNGMILDTLMNTLEERGISLYPAQEEAILALYENHNVILNTPTGSGKSLVATALHLKSLAWGSRSVYTCPIKALVNEKFLALCAEFGARNVGIITGDSSVNSDAPVLCCTAEILSNMALRYGTRTGFDDVIMDEFHYYSDRDRGAAWQIPLLTMRDSRFLLMSATLGDTSFFQEKLTELNGCETDLIASSDRPVPLDFVYQEVPLHETIADLIKTGRAPIYLVHFTQLDAAESAQNFLSTDFCSKEEKAKIQSELGHTRFDSPYGKDLARLLRHGIGLHHAGLLPKYRIIVEKLAQQGLLKIICGTDTLGVGVNVPIRTVAFTQLCKFDGEKTAILSVRDFMQISGRAGRKGFDDRGTVVVQAPEHVVENLRMDQKAANDPKKMKKLVKKKPPAKGFVHWNQETFVRLTSTAPEPLVSRFRMTHAIILNVLSRESNGVTALRNLIRDCHESDFAKKQLRKSAFELFRSLLVRGIVEFVPREEIKSEQTPVRVNVDLQVDFSLNQSLSLFLVDAIKLLDTESEDFALRLLTLVESIQENPDVILRRQLARAKDLRMAEMKQDGLEYEERMAELEKIEYPKPDADFIYDTFNAFQAAHPWVTGENIRPKSIARDMYTQFQTFDEYIRDYGLQRSEGVLLRYLSYVYHALAQTIPDLSKTDEVRSIEDYFGSMIRDVDSSLLDEWRNIDDSSVAGDGSGVAAAAEIAAAALSQAEKLRMEKDLRILARNAVFRFLRAFSQGDFVAALRVLNAATVGPNAAAEVNWTEESLASTHEELKAERGALLFHAAARSPDLTHFFEENEDDAVSGDGVKSSGPRTWRIEQTLLDESEFNDCCAVFLFNCEKSFAQKRAVISLREIRK
jgi:superfamily II RNA helicase